MTLRPPLLTLCSSLALLAGCASTLPVGPGAMARLAPTTGNATSGTVRFTQVGSVVAVEGEVRGLKANALHGFHVHETGDCSSGDGMSTGGHFNPARQPHGNAAAAPHHAGDLRSLQADANGVARFKFEANAISVGSGAANIVGKGLIVHRDPDDYTTQPTGNAGPRLACAVIASR